MELKDCLNMMVNIRNNINTQWSYYFLLVTITIGWLLLPDKTGSPLLLSGSLKALGTVGLFLFAALNILGLTDMYRMLQILTEEAQAIDGASWRSETGRTWIQRTSYRNRVRVVWAIHLSVGLVLLILIWWDDIRFLKHP